jgi:hypothetical protein
MPWHYCNIIDGGQVIKHKILDNIPLPVIIVSTSLHMRDAAERRAASRSKESVAYLKLIRQGLVYT